MPASAELFQILPPADALARLFAHWQPTPSREVIDTADALGRVLAGDVLSREDLPAFRRSTVDGYAVIAADTHGASPGLPALLTVAGEAAMGTTVDLSLATGQAVLIHTGAMLPPAADAVIMVEHTQPAPTGEIEVMRPVAAGDNVLQIGEDIRVDAVAYACGRTLRAQDIGGLMALGVTRLAVAARPRVGIVSTGDEVVPPDQTPGPGQVRDVNSYALAAQVQVAGGIPVRYGIVPDQREALTQTLARAQAECDIVVTSAGSSISARDVSVEVIAELGAPGVLVHGVAVKPGKPSILAVCDGVPVFGLPGNPASAMIIFDLFVAPVIRAQLGASPTRPHHVRAVLARNIPSAAGREDHVQVNLSERDGVLTATPVFGKSNLIYTLVKAAGRVRVELDLNGIAAGTEVDVLIS
jgi:molybdopterin molybdotransferase